MVNKPDTGEKKNLMTTRHEENSGDGHEDGVPQDEVLGVKPRAFEVKFLLKVGDILPQDEVVSLIPRAFEVHLLELLLKVGEPLAQDEVIGVKPRGFKDLELTAIGLEDILKHSSNDHSARHIYTGTDMPSMQRAQMLLMERADLMRKKHKLKRDMENAVEFRNHIKHRARVQAIRERRDVILEQVRQIVDMEVKLFKTWLPVHSND